MNLSRSILCWMAAWLVSACAAPSVSAPSDSEIELASEDLTLPYCKKDLDCPVTNVACRLCSDGSYSCPEPHCNKGRCQQIFPECPPYDPCGGKQCGDSCRICDPQDPKCIETAVVKYCQLGGSCSPNPPVCDKCAVVKCSAGHHCIDGACIPDEPKVFCGGIANIQCPGAGQCVDDPSDGCDPKNGGADCGGMCVCKALAKCAAGTHFDATASVCACVPDNVFCGGIAGIQCPGKGQCVDDPSDNCDPKNGGADCGGLCQCPLLPSAKCPVGSHWDSSPGVCACAPGIACGTKVCGADQTCCSPSCGICGSKGGLCPTIACATPL